jgi:rhomboid protease GluP
MNEHSGGARRHPSIAGLRRFLARFQWSDVLSEPVAPVVPDSPDWPAAPAALPPSPARVAEFSLVLSARGIPNRPRYNTRPPKLLVRADRLAEATAEIALYVRENAGQLQAPEPSRPRFDNTRAVFCSLICLGAFFSLTAADVGVAWLKLGGGDSGAIVSGQWWRLATALSLHGDAAHMAGNLILGGAFMLPLCREIGAGPGFALALASGILGNLLKVAFQGPGAHFIGASTAVFGAVGLLGAILAVRGAGGLGFRRLAPAGAALMFLAFLGSGSEEVRNIDLAGHFFGFAAGVLMGLGLAGRLPRADAPRPGFQAACALLAAACLPAAWIWALAATWPH